MSVPVLSQLFGACRRTAGTSPAAPAAALHRPALSVPTPAACTRPAARASSPRAARLPEAARQAQPLEPILLPRLRICFADFPYLHCSIDQRLFTLGDLLRISVRPGMGVTEALPRIFKGRRQRTGRHLKCGARPSRGAYLRPTRFQARGSSRRKDNSSRDCRRRFRVRSRCRHQPRPTPCSGSGMLTRFPVAGWRPRLPSNRPTSGRPSRLGVVFPSLRID